MKTLKILAGLLVASLALFAKKAFGAPITYTDLTKQTKDVKVFSKKKNTWVKIREKESTPKKFLMLHQTDGSQKAKAAQFKTVKAHIGIPGDGPLVLIHPIGADVVGSYSNTTSVEVAGKFPAQITEGPYARQAANFDTTHRDVLTESQKAAIRYAIDMFVEHGWRNGLKPSGLQLIGHNQTYNMRTFDPGKEIWQVGARYAKLRGMIVDENYNIDSGIPIHKEWRVN